MLIASGHLASFDRRKCKGPLNGPTATGQQCPEGWTLYQLPGPQLQGVTDSGSAEASYYDWVDQFDTLGLGKNVPIATGNGNDTLLALLPTAERLSFCACLIPWGFMPKGWTAGSMIRKRAGRARKSGRPTAREHLFTRKAAKGRRARYYIFSFGLIHLHSKWELRPLRLRRSSSLRFTKTQSFSCEVTEGTAMVVSQKTVQASGSTRPSVFPETADLCQLPIK
jgi:hypothetical protein